MRGVALGVTVLVLGLAIPVTPAAAESPPAPPAPVTRCRVSDPRIDELSGLVADGRRWYAINDGGTAATVFVLRKNCTVDRVITGPTDPYDVEDLGWAPDGSFWLSDTGDNDLDRKTVALISLTRGGASTLHRLSYPDGPHDTEALLVGKDGTPYLVTKSATGTAGVYRPTARLASPGPTPLAKVGTVEIASTTTPGGPIPGIVGSVTVTGGAVSADGSVIALRTYTDVYLWRVGGNDIPAALRAEPVRVPLPNEAQGEAIAFEPNGTLVSGSEGIGEPIRAVPGATALVAPPPDTSSAKATTEASGGATGGRPDGLPILPAAAVTVALVGGVYLLFRGRQARRR